MVELKESNTNIKLTELKEKIEARRNELVTEMNGALSRRQMTFYEHLEHQKLQCDAEIRLINHIENNFEGEFLIS